MFTMRGFYRYLFHYIISYKKYVYIWTIPPDPIPAIHYRLIIFNGCACDTFMFFETQYFFQLLDYINGLSHFWIMSGEFSVAKRIP